MKVYTLPISTQQSLVIPKMADAILSSRKSVNTAARVAKLSPNTARRAILHSAAAIRESQGQVVLNEQELAGLLAILYTGDLITACGELKMRTLGAAAVINELLAIWPTTQSESK